MPDYRTVEPEVETLLKEVMSEFHKDLVEVKLTVQLSGAYAKRDKKGKPRLPTLKLHGVPVLGIASVISYEDRVNGAKDVKIKLDMDAWPDLSDKRRRGLLSHELEHFLLVRDKEGYVKTDGAFRPMVRIRPHDYEAGVFLSCAERFGMDSVEAAMFLPMQQALTQKLLPFDTADPVGMR